MQPYGLPETPSASVVLPVSELRWMWSRLVSVIANRYVWLSLVAMWIFVSLAVPDQSMQIVMGHNDTMYVSGMYDVEQLARNGGTVDYRWTGMQSSIRFPHITGGPKIISLLMLNGSPNTLIPETVQLYLTPSRVVTTLLIASNIRQYQVLDMRSNRWGWSVPLQIKSDVWHSTSDSRSLGVMLLAAHINLATNFIPVVGMYTILCVLGIVFLLSIIAIMMHATPTKSISIVITCNVLISFCLWWRPYEIEPFLYWGVMWVLVGVVGMSVAYVIGVLQFDWRVRGVDLPFWCGVVWWSLPIIQLLLKADHITIRLTSYEHWMGILLGVLLTSGGLSTWLLRRNGYLRSAQLIGQWYGLVSLAIMSLVHQAVMLPRVFQYGSGDFSIWLNAARRWIHTGVLYQIKTVADNPFAVYKRPPFYILLFTPFIAMADMTVLNYFRVINIGLFLLTLLLWMAIIKPQARWWWVGALVLLANYQPLYDSVMFGQTDVVLLFGFTLAFWCTRTNRDGWAGVVIAFLTSLKIYPIIILAFFVIKRRWWALIGFVAGMVLWNGLAILVSDWHTSAQFLTTVLPSIGGTTSWIDNQTITGFLARFYDTPYEMHRFAVPNVEHIASYLSMLVSAGVCLLALRDFPRESSAYALQYGLFMLLMVLAIPVAWMHYTALLIMVFIMVWWHYRERMLGLGQVGVAGLSFGLLAFGHHMSFGYPEYYGIVTLLLASYKFFGMLLLLGLITYELWQADASWAPEWRQDLGKWWAVIRRAQPASSPQT